MSKVKRHSLQTGLIEGCEYVLASDHDAEVAALRADAERNWEAVLHWERWAAEVLTDFRVPFDNHKVALRLGIVQLIHDAARAKTTSAAGSTPAPTPPTP